MGSSLPTLVQSSAPWILLCARMTGRTIGRGSLVLSIATTGTGVIPGAGSLSRTLINWERLRLAWEAWTCYLGEQDALPAPFLQGCDYGLG